MRYILCSVILIFITSCSREDGPKNCNFLLSIGVNATVNLNLPEYSQLQFTSNSVYVANHGNGGLIVTNVGAGNFRAWDATDPNHIPSSCSRLTIDGANAVCGCQDANEYSLFTGQKLGTPLPCGLKEYRITMTGSNSLLVTN